MGRDLRFDAWTPTRRASRRGDSLLASTGRSVASVRGQVLAPYEPPARGRGTRCDGLSVSSQIVCQGLRYSERVCHRPRVTNASALASRAPAPAEVVAAVVGGRRRHAILMVA